MRDTLVAHRLLAGLTLMVSQPKKIWANWDLEIVERDPGVRGFSIQPHRRIVEHMAGLALSFSPFEQRL
jgi:hypothetical protein